MRYIVESFPWEINVCPSTENSLIRHFPDLVSAKLAFQSLVGEAVCWLESLDYNCENGQPLGPMSINWNHRSETTGNDLVEDGEYYLERVSFVEGGSMLCSLGAILLREDYTCNTPDCESTDLDGIGNCAIHPK